MFHRRRRRDDPGPTSAAGPERGSDAAPAPGAEVVRAEGDGHSVIGSQTRVRGRLKGQGALLVCGSVVGEIDVRGGLTLAPTGRIDAQVDVHSADLFGRARGSMRAASRVRLDTSAVFEGRMTTPVIDLRPGAVLHGRASIAGPALRPRRRPAR